MNHVAQVVILAISGVGAFYAASDWSRGRDAETADIVAPAPRPAASAAAPAASTTPDTSADTPARVRSIPATGGSAFGPLNWQPPPPPPPPPVVVATAPPPAPTAPPLPFTFVGFVERGAERPQAYLAKGEALLIVGVGDQIDNNTYRVESLSGAGVVLTYLPLGKQQTVNAPGAKP